MERGVLGLRLRIKGSDVDVHGEDGRLPQAHPVELQRTSLRNQRLRHGNATTGGVLARSCAGNSHPEQSEPETKASHN